MSVKRQYVQCIVVYNHLRSSRLTWVVSPFIPMFAIRSVGPTFSSDPQYIDVSYPLKCVLSSRRNRIVSTMLACASEATEIQAAACVTCSP